MPARIGAITRGARENADPGLRLLRQSLWGRV